MKLIFLDEAGFAKNWEKSIADQPFHVLGGFLIDSSVYFSASRSLRESIVTLDLDKASEPLGYGFEIKAKEIAKGTGWWKSHKRKRNKLRELMLSFPKKYDGDSFLIVIDKQRHLNRYAHPDPPHEIAFKFMFERLQWKLMELHDEAICIYDQTKFLDDDLHNASVCLMRDGSPIQYWSEFYGYVSQTFRIDMIREFYLGKSDNSIGLQVADYIATFGYQYFRKGKPIGCGWWDTLVGGIYRKNGEMDGYGLKVFP